MTAPIHVVLGVSASVALHRALDLTSELRKRGRRVSVVMSPNATRLITPLAFQAISLSKVFHEMWETVDDLDHDHVRLAGADVMILAPATAGTIAKIAHGFADNVLTATAMTFAGPRLFAPAMNWRMWENPAVQENCAKLQARGWRMVPPTVGDLACGEQGLGRLAAVQDLLAAVESAAAERGSRP